MRAVRIMRECPVWSSTRARQRPRSLGQPMAQPMEASPARFHRAPETTSGVALRTTRGRPEPMRPIIGVVHRDEGSAYGVSFPDAPGCFAAADELDGLIPAAVEALTLWAEEGELPVPRDMDVIRAEVADELAQGAALVAVPLVVRARVPRRGERVARSRRARGHRRRGAPAGHDALGLPRRGGAQRDRGAALTISLRAEGPPHPRSLPLDDAAGRDALAVRRRGRARPVGQPAFPVERMAVIGAGAEMNAEPRVQEAA